jgi:type II secretory pathway component GspD/PulD (secretin)
MAKEMSRNLLRSVIALGILMSFTLDLCAEDDLNSAQTTEPTIVSVSNVFVDSDLREVLQDIASQVGVIIVPDESVEGLVTCELKEAPLEKALEIVLAGTGYVVKKTPDYYLVCSTDPKSASFLIISKTQLLKLNYVKATTAVKLLSPAFRDYVQANDDAGTVCISATDALMNRIVADLKLIDRPPRHVMLDARVVVMERSNLLNLGIQWDWPQIQAGTFSSSYLHGGGTQEVGGKWPWGIQIGYTTSKEFTDSLLLTLNLLAQNNEATVVASPQVLAQDGKEAEIKVFREEYFKIVTEGYYTRSQLEKIESGTLLKITPHIGENNDITLEMSTEVSDVVAYGEDDLPVVTRRSATSTVRIEDGGTAAVAGLMDSRTRVAKSKTPGLGDIPILGELFRNRSTDVSSRQVAIFITAHLIQKTESPTVEPLADRVVIEPVGDEFNTALRESLSRLSGGNKKL